MTQLESPAPVVSTESEERVDRILTVIHDCPEPVSLPALEKRLTGALRMSRSELERLLDGQVQADRLTRFAPYRSRWPRYWDRGLDEYLQRLIQRRLDDQAGKSESQKQWAMTEAALWNAVRKPAGSTDRKAFSSLLQNLVEEGQVYRLPQLSKRSRTVRYSTESPRAEEYLQPFVDDIHRTAEKLSGCDVSPRETLRIAERMLAEAFGIADVADSAGMLLECLREAEVSGGDGVTIGELRHALEFRWPQTVDLYEVVQDLTRRNDILIHGDDEPDDETRISLCPSGAPAQNEPVPSVAPADLDALILEGTRELRMERHHYNGRVPIPELRQWVAQHAGDEAASHRMFDDALKRLRSQGRFRLIAISDTGQATADEIAAAVPGVHETLFYIEESGP